jgi:riboflavin kinase / FMN adenylyltransferase
MQSHLTLLEDKSWQHTGADIPKGAVVAIGNFDGMHLGHQAILHQAKVLATAHNAPVLLLTFDPHPRAFFAPESPLFLLSTPQKKAEKAAQFGVDQVITLAFNAALAALPAEDFLISVLQNQLGLSGVVVGHDFHFGAKRSGTPAVLQAWCAAHKIDYTCVDPVLHKNQVVSSSRVRQLLAFGDVEAVAQLLGMPWQIEGQVQKGAQRGRLLGFPTANIALPQSCQLRHGIYGVTVRGIDHAAQTKNTQRAYSAIASFGTRPVFDNGSALLEVFIFDFSEDLYGKMLSVEFLSWVREEKNFSSVDELIQQMHQDVARVADTIT